MNALALTQVDFHGDALFAVERDGAVFIAIKPIVLALGLDWKSQHRRISVDQILREGMVTMTIPSPGGAQETTLLSLELVHGWLFTIDESRVKDEEVRQRVLLYKRECYRALFNRFFGAQRGDHHGLTFDDVDADGVRNLRTPSEDLGPLSDLSSRCRLVEITERLAGKEAARALWRHLGLPWVAEMEARGAAVAPADDAVARFALEGIERAPGVVAPAAMLWHAFSAFCERHDLVNPGEKSFFTRFSRMGFSKRKSAGRSVYQSIRPRGPNDSAGEGRAE